MEINNALVKHYIQYDITVLDAEERKALAKEVNNAQVLNPFANGIIKANETQDSKWLVSFTRDLNQLSVKLIIKQ